MAAGEYPKLMILLKQIAEEQNYPNYELQVTPTSSGGANYSSKLYRVKVTGDRKDELRLFAKVAALGETLREQSVIKPFQNERFVYTELVKVYRGLEESRGFSNEHKLKLPEYYGAEITNLEEIIVLEDLSVKGFVQQTRLESVSWEYAASAVTELAKFHALSHAFKHKDPRGFDKIVNTFQQGMFTEHEGNHSFYNKSVKTALENVREENKEKLKTFMDRRDIGKFSSQYGALRHPVLIHADYRPSNMLHRLRKDGTVELIAVDYQTIQGGCPVIDLLYFIFTATDGPFRDKHYQQLVDLYHSELGAALARHGLKVEEIYSREDFEFELKEKLPYGLMVSVLILSILLVAEDAAPPVGKELDMALMAVQTTSQYVNRINEVVDNYVAWGILV